MIIVEGCDNTGKTTLVNTLLRRYPQLVLGEKLMGPPTEKQELMDMLWGALGSEESHRTIFDRFYFSELVYGKVLRGDVFISPAERQAINWILKKRKPIIIYCYLDPVAIRATFLEREQLAGAWDKVEELVAEYSHVFMDWASYEDFYIYDYRNPVSVARAIHGVHNYIKYRVNFLSGGES